MERKYTVHTACEQHITVCYGCSIYVYVKSTQGDTLVPLYEGHIGSSQYAHFWEVAHSLDAKNVLVT